MPWCRGQQAPSAESTAVLGAAGSRRCKLNWPLLPCSAASAPQVSASTCCEVCSGCQSRPGLRVCGMNLPLVFESQQGIHLPDTQRIQVSRPPGDAAQEDEPLRRVGSQAARRRQVGSGRSGRVAGDKPASAAHQGGSGHDVRLATARKEAAYVWGMGGRGSALQLCIGTPWQAGWQAGHQSSQVGCAMGLQLQPVPLQAMLELFGRHIREAADDRQVAVAQQVGRGGRRGGAAGSRRLADVRPDALPGSGCRATGRGMAQGAQGATGCSGRKQGTVGSYAGRRRNSKR